MIKTEDGTTYLTGTFSDISTDFACIVSSMKANCLKLFGGDENAMRLWIIALVAAGFDDELKPESSIDLSAMTDILKQIQGEDTDEDIDSV